MRGGGRRSREDAAPQRETIGGAERARTVDLLSAIQALSQAELQPHIAGSKAPNGTLPLKIPPHFA